MKVRTIILVHGVGEQGKGEFLEAVLEPLLRFLRGNFAKVQAQVSQRPEAGPAAATVSFLDERWEVREAWWARAFYPQARPLILQWAFRALIWNVGSLLVGTLPILRAARLRTLAQRLYPRRRPRRGAGEVLAEAIAWVPKALLLAAWATVLGLIYLALLLPAVLLQPLLSLANRVRSPSRPSLANPLSAWLEKLTRPSAPPSARGGLPAPQASAWSLLFDLLIGLFFTIVFALAYIPLLVLAALFLTLALLPSWLLFPRWLGTAALKVSTFLVEGFGDQYALMYAETAAASVRQALFDLLDPYLNRRSPGHRPCDSVAVIAHSAGATVALGVLSDPRSWQRWTGQDWDPRARAWTGGQVPSVPVTLFTIGSSLNVSYENVPSHPMFRQPLPPQVTWLDLWARYDPVPHGPPGRGLRAATHGRGRFETIRVVNQDSPFADHSVYWTNHEEVLSLLLHEIAGHPQLAGPDPNEQEKANAVLLAASRAGPRRTWIGVRNTLGVLLIGGLALVAGIWASLFVRVGARALAVLSGVLNGVRLREPLEALGRAYRTLQEGLPFWTPSLQALARAGEFAAGMALFSVGVYFAVRVLFLLFSVLRYRDPWGQVGGR